MTENNRLGTLLPIADHNIRDLGGIRTADGRVVASKRLIRGDHLSKCSDACGDVLTTDYQVNLVIDLRRPSEMARQPDRIFDGVTYAQASVIADAPRREDGGTKSAKKPVALQMVEQVRAMAGGVIAHQTKLYRDAASDPVTIAALKSIVKRLLTHKTGAVYWHCTAGKDRTGMVSAMILLALGVDQKTVRAEYLRTNEIIAEKVARIADFCAPYAENDEDIREIRRWCLVHPDYFDAVMDEIQNGYGSAAAYLSDVLGLDDEKREELCARYLIS